MATAGSLLIKSMLPPEVQKHYDPNMVLDKKGVTNLMSLVIKHGGSQAHETIQNLSNLFFHTATVNGFSTPLTDYENDSQERNVFLDEYVNKINAVNDNAKLTRAQKTQALNEVAGQYVKKSQDLNLKYMVGKGSTAGLMALTGARGNPMQLGQGTFSPMMSVDIEGKPIPLPIRHSFAEGLTPAEHLAMAYGGRAATIKTQMATSEPGALFKKLVPSVFHEVITVHNCGTKNGTPYDIHDRRRVVGHVEAGTDHMVDDAYYKEKLSSGAKTITIRTPTTCEAHEGICQMCYGRDSRGNYPEIGENVGVVAAESISEGMIQAVIDSKHQGGTAGSKIKATQNMFEASKNLLTIPENFQDAATLATAAGKVNKIEKTALGDFHVHVNGIPHFVPQDQGLKVKEGDHVYAGQELSEGTPNPKELVELRGLGAGREYFSKKLREVYGNDLDPRHFDVIARNVAKYVKIKNPGDTDFLPGDIVEVGKVAHEFDKGSQVVPIERAVGKVLARRVSSLMPGTLLDHQHVRELNQRGIHEVPISTTGLSVEPMATGVKQSKLLDPNWISRLASSNLKSSIIEAASQSQESPLHSTDPIAPYIFGKTFGEGEHGRY